MTPLATWNPIDWPAGPFLTLYATLAMIVFVLGFGWRSMIGPKAIATPQLSIVELAYLAGGAKRLGDAVLLCLTSRNGATIDPKAHKITVVDQTPLESLTARPAPLTFALGMTRQQFQIAIKPFVAQVQARLQGLGLCPSEDQMATLRLSTLPFVACLFGLGLIKAFVGSERGHSIGFLIAFLIGTAIAGIFLATRPVRTHAGHDVLQSYQSNNARAARAPLDHELLLAVALTGAIVLKGTAFAPVYAASLTMSSGDGGGGGGCGGGGGGGCGGCS